MTTMTTTITAPALTIAEGKPVLGHTVGTLTDVEDGFFLSNLSTDWDHRGTGSAGRYVAALIADADARGIALHLVPGDEALQAWYARLGFEINPTERGIAKMPYMTRLPR